MALENWPIFDFLKSTFPEINNCKSKIHKVLVFGDQGNEALIVTKNRKVFAMGTNKSGCLGVGHKHAVFVPTEIESLRWKDIKTFAYGKGPHVLALTCAGEVYSWGHNVHNELGNIHEAMNSIHESSIPKLISIFSDNEISIVDVACGTFHSLALANSGEVYTWGKNDCGQAGVNLNDQCVRNVQKTPTKVDFLSNKNKVICISCGASSNTVVTENGDVYSWGDNNVGQLGIGSKTKFSSKPCLIKTLDGIMIKKVTCGAWHTLALSEEGDLFVWGCIGEAKVVSSRKIVWTPLKLTILPRTKVLDIASSHSTDISVVRGTNNQIFVWGNCLGQYISKPMLTSVSCIHDAFANYTTTRVMHKPLTVCKDDKIHILQSLKGAFDNPSTSDLIIEVQGYPIHVNKFILKIRSHYFKTLFQEESMKNNLCNIKEEQFSYDVYTAYLKYLYTDEIDFSPTNSFELFKLANIYSEYQLQKRCKELILKNITVSNVTCLYSEAIAYNIKIIEESCLNFALKRMTQVVQSPSFAQLNESVVKAFIIEAAKAGAFQT